MTEPCTCPQRPPCPMHDETSAYDSLYTCRSELAHVKAQRDDQRLRADRLEAVLAAAIDLVADVESSTRSGWERVQERYRKMDALRDALAALGVTVGQEGKQ